MGLTAQKSSLSKDITPRDLGIYGINIGPEREFEDSKTGVRYEIDRDTDITRIRVTLPPRTGITVDDGMMREDTDSKISSNPGFFKGFGNLFPHVFMRYWGAKEKPNRIAFVNNTKEERSMTLRADMAVYAVDLEQANGHVLTKRGAFAMGSYSNARGNKFNIPWVTWRTKPGLLFGLLPMFYKGITGDDVIKQKVSTNASRSNIAFFTSAGTLNVSNVNKGDARLLPVKRHGYELSSANIKRGWGMNLGDTWTAINRADETVLKLKLRNAFRKKDQDPRDYVILSSERAAQQAAGKKGALVPAA